MGKLKRMGEDLELDTHQSKVARNGLWFKSQIPRMTATTFFETYFPGQSCYLPDHPGLSLDPNRDLEIGGTEYEVPNNDEVVLKLCELALKSLEDSHPGEKYQFVGVKNAKVVAVAAGYLYNITFEAKNLKGDVKTFEAVGYDLIRETLKIESCVLLE